MKQSVRLGRVAGIPLGLHWSVLMILVLVTVMLAAGVLSVAVPGLRPAAYLGAALPVAVLFFGTLLMHELAHSLVAVRSGVRVRSITLWMLGGVSELEDEAPSPRAELAIALAGPAASVALALVSLGAALAAGTLEAPALISYGLGWLAVTNFVLAVFNMLPGAPLDGGRVLRALLWWRYGDRSRADRIAARTGRFIAAALILLGIYDLLMTTTGTGLWLIVLGWFLFSAAGLEASSREIRDALAGLRARDVMTPDPDVAAGWSTVAVFARRVLPASRQSVFPVVDDAGSITGVVTLETLARVPGAQRDITSLRTIALRASAEYLVGPDTPVAGLLGRRPLADRLVAMVVEAHRLIGMVTVDDLTMAIQRTRLASVPTSNPGS